MIATTIDSSTLGYIIGGVFGLAGIILGLYINQRNRSADKVDAAILKAASERSADNANAFNAWQQINAANTASIASLTTRLDLAEARALKCEMETVPKLREDIAKMQEAHQAEVEEMREARLGLLARLSALEGKPPPQAGT